MEYQDIAYQHISTSIDLFNDEDYLCAITLAGAAEEICGKLIKFTQGGEHFVDDLVGMLDNKLEGVVRKEIVSRINNTRDMLKHFSPDRRSHDMKPYDDAVFMICRAIINFCRLTRKSTQKINDFINKEGVIKVLNSYSTVE